MSVELIGLSLAVGFFVLSHFVLSHPLRPWAVRAFGPAGFQVLYSLVALVGILAILYVYHVAPHGPMLWSSDNLALQLVFAVVGYFAVALFIASLIGNPGLVGANLNGLSTRTPDGVYKITRHPMMFAITLWLSVQILVIPSARNLITCGGLIVLAVLGAHWQDGKKTALSGREWSLWVARTPFWPDLRRIGGLGALWGVAVFPWLLVTWIEVRVTFVPVGVWYFLPNLPY
jgi:uncharacterized membrane protein